MHQQHTLGDGPVVLRRGHVLDEGGGFTGPVDVHVESGSVVEVGRDLKVADAREVDFEGLYVMPGVFDVHDHLGLSTLDPTEALETPVSRWALEAAQNARQTLEGGVTFVRDLGGIDAGFRDGIASGFVPGPRVQVSINLVAQTGGHGDGFLPSIGREIVEWYLTPELPDRPPVVVDGPDEMRKVVRMLIRAGADWIKLATTGPDGPAEYDGGPYSSQFTLAEIEVAVQEAARKGKWVAAHAQGGEGLDNAIAAGVRSIEHAFHLTEEQATAIAAAGAWVVPTLVIHRDLVAWAEEFAAGTSYPKVPRSWVESTIEAQRLHPPVETVQICKEHGIPLAVGSDYSDRSQHGRNLEEVALMREAGLTPEEALLAATINGAELCGVGDRYGRIAQGYVFDAIVLDEDPGDLSIFNEPGAVTGVMLGGEPVVPHERLRSEVLAAETAA
jgi:imidazolonepropionase-like amidohydrolase